MPVDYQFNHLRYIPRLGRTYTAPSIPSPTFTRRTTRHSHDVFAPAMKRGLPAAFIPYLPPKFILL